MKAKVISTYQEDETGKYVHPPAEVDLSQSEVERLTKKGCLEPLKQTVSEPKAETRVQPKSQPKRTTTKRGQ